MVKFDYHQEKKHLICKFSGRMDTNESLMIIEEVQNKIMELKQGKDDTSLLDEKIDFDMKESDFISSSFIRICLVVYKQTAEGKFSIRNCDPFLKKTFKIAGLDAMLKVS